jgi:hypothetical protein
MLVGIALIVLYILCCAFTAYYRTAYNKIPLAVGGPGMDYREEARRLFEAIAGYGLGGSSIAMFGRVGGTWKGGRPHPCAGVGREGSGAGFRSLCGLHGAPGHTRAGLRLGCVLHCRWHLHQGR